MYLCIEKTFFHMSKIVHLIKIFIMRLSYVAVLLSGVGVLLSSCSDGKKRYLIGVSQCSEDSWRSKLNSELEQSTYFNEGVSVVMRSADDNIEQQRRQIQELVDMNIDLLIVSPQQTGNLSDAISIAAKKDIPVILFDRKSGADNYTAFMGADNYMIGQMMADYAASQMAGHGNIVEIAGEHKSSPAMERHKGFNDAIRKYPDIHIVGYAEGDWKQPSGEVAMQQILDQLYPVRDGVVQEGPQIDCIFGGNDRMAVGARKALEKFVQVHPEATSLHPSKMLYLGVDALPTPGGGIEKVRDGELTVSAIYPTHGDELMELALNILEGNSYEKETMMETNMVTQANARVLLMQYKEVENQIHYIKRMHARVDTILGQLDTQRIVLFGIIGMTFILSLFTILTVRAYRVKRNLNRELRKKNDELNEEKAKVEHQRDELEEQRDQLLDLTETLKNRSDCADGDVDAVPSEAKDTVPEVKPELVEENSFVARFLQYVGEHLSDPDLSVEDIGEELCLSRVQLYRKIKSMTGKTPVEIIREERLKRSKVLLEDASLSISEVAYKVGFSAPSYFTKCYKDYYGKAPSGKSGRC